MKKSTILMMIIAIPGFLLGGFIGFLGRPSSVFVGQLSFEHVITRGSNLQGLDELLIPLAQQSFNIMLMGAIIGAVVGMIIGYFAGKK